jgi:histidinol-phosphate aminotransferase
LIVVADEAYAEYVRDPGYPDTVHERGDDRVPVVTLRTFSKLFGLAGLRVGYAVAPPAVIDMLARVRQPFNVNGLAQVGALAALDDTAHVERTLAVNREGMAYLTDALTRLGVPFVPSEANFLLVRVGRGLDVYDALLRRGVIARPMDGYGFPEYLRVTVGLPDENRRFVETLAAVLGGR